jgi:periplasmic protein TonB
MVRTRITAGRSPARAAHAGILPGLGRLKLARVPAPAKAPRAGGLPDPASLQFTRAEAWPRTPPENRSALFRSVAIALAAHALALWFVLPSTAPELARGGGGQHLEAIEVTLVRSPVIESRDKNPAEKPAGANSETAPKDGERSKSLTATPPEDVPRAADEPLLKRETRPAPSNNGATARAIEENGHASGPASASPGAVQQYAARVREALARSKPDSFGNRGTAMIKFSISQEGKAGSIEVTISSGSAALDKSALEAVTRTSFPAPPAGMTETERTYVVPFHFK